MLTRCSGHDFCALIKLAKQSGGFTKARLGNQPQRFNLLRKEGRGLLRLLCRRFAGIIEQHQTGREPFIEFGEVLCRAVDDGLNHAARFREAAEREQGFRLDLRRGACDCLSSFVARPDNEARNRGALILEAMDD